MKQLILVMGPQASGKTTFVNNFMLIHNDYTRIASDLYWPSDLFGNRYWFDNNCVKRDWHTDPMPKEIRDKAHIWAYDNFVKSIKLGLNIILEATLTKHKHRSKYIKIAMSNDYYIEGKFFLPSLTECLYRNRNRKDKVPESVLTTTYNDIDLPTIHEGFNVLSIKQ